MSSYKLSFEVEEDIRRLYEYGFYKFGIIQADKYYDMLFDCFDKIASNPLMFPIAVRVKNSIRYCVCGVDTIYYKINANDSVDILTIIGKQNF